MHFLTKARCNVLIAVEISINFGSHFSSYNTYLRLTFQNRRNSNFRNRKTVSNIILLHSNMHRIHNCEFGFIIDVYATRTTIYGQYGCRTPTRSTMNIFIFTSFLSYIPMARSRRLEVDRIRSLYQHTIIYMKSEHGLSHEQSSQTCQ